MFRILNRLTTATNNYIDFSRAASTIFSKNISQEEFIKRGLVIVITGTSMFLAAQYNDEEKTNCSNTTISIGAGILSLILAHVFLAGHLIYKRYQLSEDCQQLVNEIGKNVKDIPSLPSEALDNVIETILKMTMADAKHSNASLTWGRRKTLLTNLNRKLENNDEEFLSLLNNGPTSRILNYLNEIKSCVNLKNHP